MSAISGHDNKINYALVAGTSKLSRFFSVFGQRVVKTSMSLGSWFELQCDTFCTNNKHLYPLQKSNVWFK